MSFSGIFFKRNNVPGTYLGRIEYSGRGLFKEKFYVEISLIYFTLPQKILYKFS
jgi:hypothetical protein